MAIRVLSFCTVYYAVQGGSNFKSLCATIQMKAIEQYFHVVLFNMLYEKVVLDRKSVV